MPPASPDEDNVDWLHEHVQACVRTAMKCIHYKVHLFKTAGVGIDRTCGQLADLVGQVGGKWGTHLNEASPHCH